MAGKDTDKQDGELPDLPDVPTEEPTEEGQPKSKKAKLEDAAVKKQ